MVASEAAGVVVDVNHGAVIITPVRLSQQADFVAAVLHFELEACQVCPWQRSVTFRPVIAGVFSSDRSDEDGITAHRHFHLVIHLQPYVALAFAARHVIACHAANLKSRVCHSGQCNAES